MPTASLSTYQGVEIYIQTKDQHEHKDLWRLVMHSYTKDGSKANADWGNPLGLADPGERGIHFYPILPTLLHLRHY